LPDYEQLKHADHDDDRQKVAHRIDRILRKCTD